MERAIEIDGRPVKFRATAAIPRMYRMQFGRDIMVDFRELEQAAKEAAQGNGSIPIPMLEIFENVPFLMARHADPQMEEETVEAWLDGFETFSIYEVLPQLLELWKLNNQTVDHLKKKQDRLTGR